ncbi:ABC transporter ATP-binding protein [Maritimibacter dapengensis]|uniref:ABC transporter ATP-binding protein/permease n=1 Tax=Maritimibacter dapengensis TaxID=2836868 RepID=A0ABS6T6C5_9RHOB|nr:ABC transporter ATP-binding protein [Maritimibacter dapengensis]MBV7380750.1 ABC transporter ATP-binding protein/permease [Maritimibacter dapengensis]
MRLSDLIDPFRPAEGPPPGTLFAFARWILKGAWPVLAVAALASAMAGASETGTAWVLGRVIDGVVETGREDFFSATNLGLFALGLGFFVLLRPIVFAFSNFMTSVVVTPAISPLVIMRLHRWMLSQSVDFFDNDFAGRLAQKQAQTANAMTNLVVESINVIFFALASVVGALVLVFSIDPWLAPIMLIWFTAYVLVIRYFIPRVRIRAKARAATRAVVTGKVVDTITNIRTVKLFANAGHEDDGALTAVKNFRASVIHFGRLAATFRLTLMTLAGMLPVFLVGGTLFAWQGGSASEGDIVAAGTISVRLAQMTGWVSFALMGLYRDIGEIEDGMRTLTPDRRLRDAPGATELALSGGEIRFDNVGFAYGRMKGGVQGIDLTVRPGEKLAIVGPSGAGKSTLVSLLLRLYDPEDGQITIDGQDIAHVTQDSLRRTIGMVTQDTAMFNRSARDNIRYGRPEADEEDVIRASDRAEAYEFIQDLMDADGREGFDAHLGERGVKLSGGQRQRIAIARAIIKDAPILVLDEATSSLDSAVEAAIQETLYDIMEDKTVIAIAHRLSTIAHMDRIIVLDDGHIVEEGSHDALLAAGGLYADLWSHQSGGFLGEAAAE